jgi:exonuclease III
VAISPPDQNIKHVNHNVLKKVHFPKQYDIPAFISTNVRKLDNKLDELQEITLLNNAKVVCITETWLTMQIPDHIIAMPGYNLFRKDRTHTVGGGVCMHIRNSIPCKHLEECIEDQVEALWMLLRPHKLSRNITCIVALVIYHTTSNRGPENLMLKDRIQRNLDKLLRKYPNALVVITGDFNPNSTGLKQTHLTLLNHLKQLVTFNTRESNTLDWFLMNRPKLFTMHQLPKFASSDHFTILAKPTE